MIIFISKYYSELKFNMIEKVTTDQRMTSLIGFALKSGNFVIGLEAIRKELIKQRISFILVNDEISKNTEKKLSKRTRSINVPVLKTSSDTSWKEKWGMENTKILGILKGDLGSNILKTLKREH
jgi:ribosomal protein L7Ae-like RNA K-turn-binding protein